MPYGSIKVDNFIHSDGSNPDVTVAISSLATKASTTGAMFTGNIDLDNQQSLRLKESGAGSTHFVALRAPASIASDMTLTFPDALPAATTTGVLQSTDAGVLTWANLTDTENQWTKGQRAELTNVDSSSGTLTIDFDASNNFLCITSEEITSVVYSNLDASSVGQTGSIFIQYGGAHAVGGWAATSRWAGGTGGANGAPALTATQDKVDRIDYVIVRDADSAGNQLVQLVATLNYAK
jgi:hypothetical protein